MQVLREIYISLLSDTREEIFRVPKNVYSILKLTPKGIVSYIYY